MHMRMRGVTWAIAQVGTACLLAGGALALSATGTAQAATPVSHHLSTTEDDISCLKASLCVAVGESSSKGTGRGNVVTLSNGAQSGRQAIENSAEQLYSVSCPSSAGCWAVGPQTSGANLVFVKISSGGRAVKAVRVKEPAGDQLGRISCVSMTSCQLAGLSFFSSPTAIEMAVWNGKKLTSLHKVSTPRKSSDTSIQRISCWHSDCAAVGYTEVSGVCTHPDFRGRGLARRLSAAVVAGIQARGDQAFLHAWKTNQAAISLYEGLGFRIRAEVNICVLKRESAG